MTAQYLKTNIAMQEGWMDGWKTPYLDGMMGWVMGGQAGVDKEPYGANIEPPLIIFKQV